MLKVIIKFGVNFLKVDESIAILLLIKKLERAISILDVDII